MSTGPAQLPIYYINLASRPDRRAFMEEQFARLGIAAERVEAVRMDEVPDELIAFHRSPRSLWRLAAGDLACGLSHQRAWSRLVSTGHPAALVLEDDAILTPPLRDFLAPETLHSLPADLVKLETFHTPVKLGTETHEVGGTMLRELCSSQMGGAAYLLRRDAAERSLASPLRNLMGIDRFLFGRGGLHLLRSRILQAVPSPCIQIDKLDDADKIGGSDIAATRPENDRSRPRRSALAVLGLHLDHTARLLALASRDWTALSSRRVAIPFVGTSETR